MARKKDAGKPSVLSQEYVIDSDSDGLVEAGSSLSKSASIAQRTSHVKPKQKDDRTAMTKDVAPAESPESEDSASGEYEAITASSPYFGDSSVERVSGGRGNTEAVKKVEKKRAALASHPAPLTIAGRPFRPPGDFGEVRPDAADFTAAAIESLSRDLSAKQVWHITAPSSVPIASIKELNVDAVRSGKSILTHHQRHYGFSSGPDDPKHLLVPERTGNVYKRMRTSVSKSYYLRQVQNHSHVEGTMNEQSTEEPHYFAIAEPPPKAAPEQPGRLRMRYKPFGTSHSPPTSTSVNEDPAPGEPGFQAPPPISTPSRESTTKRRKKKKAKRLDPSEQGGMEDDTMETHESRVPAAEVQPSSSPGDPSEVKPPGSRSDINEDEETLERKRKKKRKKFREESAS